MPVLAAGFLGGNIGHEISNLLDNEGVSHHFVKIQKDSRINITVSNLKTRKQTRLSFPGPQVTRREIDALLRLLEASLSPREIVVFGGSLPQGFLHTDLVRCLRASKRTKAHVVLDLPAPLLKKLPLAGTLLMKPNLSELEAYEGRKLKSLAEVLSAAKKLSHHVALVAVSSVGGGAILVTKKRSILGTVPKTSVQSSVGAGDSMVAGMVSVLEKKNLSYPFSHLEDLLPEVLAHGLSASLATLVRPTGELGRAKDVRRFLSKIKIRDIP